MANPFSKGWKYLMASFDQKIDENADPKVQIEQAINAAKAQHQEITEHAANIIGHQRQLEMKIDRLRKDQESLQTQARQAITLADKAAGEGDQAKADEFNNTAEVFATQLVAVEQQLEEANTMHQQAAAATEQAKAQQRESEARLKEQLAQIDQLRNQVDQAKMQEKTNEAMGALTAQQDDSVPTLDGVREKIERRYANALGAQELTQNSVGSRMDEIAASGRDIKGAARLAEIRAQMQGDAPKAVESGDSGKDDAPIDAEVEDTK